MGLDSVALNDRVGDTYPNNMLEVHIRAYFYRWRSRTTQEGDVLPFEVQLWNASRSALKLEQGMQQEIQTAWHGHR